MANQDANDIVSLNVSNRRSESTEIPVNNGGKKSSLLWVVLGCVVVGVGLGVYVYQQSLTPAVKPSPTPKPVVSTPIPSPVVPAVSVVDPDPKTISFPKAGKIRLYYYMQNWPALGVIFNVSGGGDSFVIPAGTTSAPVKILDTGYELSGPTSATIESYIGADSNKLSIGWIKPQANQCGANGFTILNVASYLTWINEQLKGEPIVSVQCWGDYSPDINLDAGKDFNDYLLVWSYTPAGASVAPSPSPTRSPSPTPSPSGTKSPTPTPSPSPSRSPSPIPSPTPTPTPSPSGTKSPSPSPSKAASPSPSTVAAVTATPTPTPSIRVAQVDTSDGVPVTGVFEVTVGTISVGLILLVAGLLGLLAL